MTGPPRISGPILGLVQGDSREVVSIPRPEKPHRAFPLLALLLIIPLVTFIATYMMSALIHDKDGHPLMGYPSFFLSSSIAKKPASCVGGFGLSITCMLAPFIAFIRHRQIEGSYLNPCPSSAQQQLPAGVKNLNDRALQLAIMAAVGGFGVANFQSGLDDHGGTITVKATHYIFAFLFFTGGMLYCLIMWRIDCCIPSLGTIRSRAVRRAFACAAGVQFAAVVVVFPPLVLSRFVPRAPLILAASFLEISLMVTFMSTYVTFYEEFRNTLFTLVILYEPRTVESTISGMQEELP